MHQWAETNRPDSENTSKDFEKKIVIVSEVVMIWQCIVVIIDLWLFGKNQQNSVKQLFFNKVINLKEKNSVGHIF